MAPQIPTGEPSEAVIGDTWQWKIADSTDYPQSEGWTPAYHVRGVSVLTWSDGWRAFADGAWTITVPASSTDDLTAGLYEWSLVWSGSGSYAGRVHTDKVGTLIVDVQLSAATATQRQGFAEKQLATVETQLAALYAAPLESYTIGQRSAVKAKIRDLEASRVRLLFEIQQRKHKRFPTFAPAFVRG